MNLTGGPDRDLRNVFRHPPKGGVGKHEKSAVFRGKTALFSYSDPLEGVRIRRRGNAPPSFLTTEGWQKNLIPPMGVSSKFFLVIAPRLGHRQLAESPHKVEEGCPDVVGSRPPVEGTPQTSDTPPRRFRGPRNPTPPGGGYPPSGGGVQKLRFRDPKK